MFSGNNNNLYIKYSKVILKNVFFFVFFQLVYLYWHSHQQGNYKFLGIFLTILKLNEKLGRNSVTQIY